jgi:hypothetical protein
LRRAHLKIRARWGVAAFVASVLLLLVVPAAVAQTVSVTTDPVGFVDTQTGVATVSGTVTCPEGEFTNGGAGGDVAVSQLFAHRVFIVAYGSFPVLACTGTAMQWSVTVTGGNGRLAPGPAHVDLSACTLNECGSASADIRLKAARK